MNEMGRMILKEILCSVLVIIKSQFINSPSVWSASHNMIVTIQCCQFFVSGTTVQILIEYYNSRCTYVLSNKDTNSLSFVICQLARDWRGRIFTVGTQGVLDDCVGGLYLHSCIDWYSTYVVVKCGDIVHGPFY